MINKTLQNIFKKGSKTYFNSSLFFPKEVRNDVFILYGFVRTADDYVDVVPQQKKAFNSFIKTYKKALKGKKANNIVIDSFVDLIKRKKFSLKWIDAFLHSMSMDLSVKKYKRLKDTEKYIYGSAEVIGLMMASIMDLPEKSYHNAQHLGKAMQYINFIRDLAEDLKLGRIYFPQEELKRFKLKSLDEDYSKKHDKQFKALMRSQCGIYKKWQIIAEKGFSYIPKRYLIPIKTASDMYLWTARQIEKDPFIVYRKKVKPSKLRIILTLIRNLF